MSTKVTIINDKLYHLYEEPFDNENVYLDLEDLSGCCVEIISVDGRTKSTATIAIPIKAWRNIVKAWDKSSWSKNEARDGSVKFLDDKRLRRVSCSRKKFDDL